MADPTLPNAPFYRNGDQTQSAIGMFLVDAAPPTPPAPAGGLIDFTTGFVIGLAEGDQTWTDLELDGYQPQMLVSTSTPILFVVGDNNDPLRGPVLLTPGLHYFRVLEPAGAVQVRFRNIDPAPVGWLTINWVL